MNDGRKTAELAIDGDGHKVKETDEYGVIDWEIDWWIIDVFLRLDSSYFSFVMFIRSSARRGKFYSLPDVQRNIIKEEKEFTPLQKIFINIKFREYITDERS